MTDPVLEQSQLIKELRLLQGHIEPLDTEIHQVVAHSREGQILTSIPPITPLAAAVIIATVGNIANFPNAAALKSYFGWAPTLTQSGTSLDATRLTPGGNRPMKKMMFLIVWNAIRMDGEWASLYQRLVPLKCAYDERTRTYKGKGKVIGRIAGQMISLMFALLKTDQEVLSKISPGTEAPSPLLYDPALHRSHREGQYQALRKHKPPGKLIQLPKE